ncbi:uncharacterized protein TrAFT101_006894 [Trichoderma asperellum]|uniref:uncharacterized protein n=1 Tax=Trichoderma asperellum TaxID=101201 RepID=UPI003328556B|nr:hypothetical protein TrAFT101_006894 [Trichoderma asperellum]
MRQDASLGMSLINKRQEKRVRQEDSTLPEPAARVWADAQHFVLLYRGPLAEIRMSEGRGYMTPVMKGVDRQEEICVSSAVVRSDMTKRKSPEPNACAQLRGNAVIWINLAAIMRETAYEASSCIASGDDTRRSGLDKARWGRSGPVSEQRLKEGSAKSNLIRNAGASMDEKTTASHRREPGCSRGGDATETRTRRASGSANNSSKKKNEQHHGQGENGECVPGTQAYANTGKTEAFFTAMLQARNSSSCINWG